MDPDADNEPEKELVVVNLIGRECANFELGGRAGNVVTASETHRVVKGWRLLTIDGAECTGQPPASVSSMLGAAQRRGRFSAAFYTGKATDLASLARAVLASKKLAAAPKGPADAKAVSKAGAKGAAPAAPAGTGAASKPWVDIGGANIDDLRKFFVSFDADRDGALGLKDFAAMLNRLNSAIDFEYDFMEAEGPLNAAYITAKYREAGGRWGVDLKDGEDEQYVSFEGFVTWYPPFVAQCEEKKRTEHAATRQLNGVQYEAYLRDRPSRQERNKNYSRLVLPAAQSSQGVVEEISTETMSRLKVG